MGITSSHKANEVHRDVMILLQYPNLTHISINKDPNDKDYRTTVYGSLQHFINKITALYHQGYINGKEKHAIFGSWKRKAVTVIEHETALKVERLRNNAALRSAGGIVGFSNLPSKAQDQIVEIIKANR